MPRQPQRPPGHSGCASRSRTYDGGVKVPCLTAWRWRTGKNQYSRISFICQAKAFCRVWLSIIIKRTETQLSRLCVFSLLQPHRTEVRLTGKYRYLTFEDRKKIEAWHLLGDRPVDIAARLSVHHTTIYKELQRGATGALDANQREGYSAELAERRLRESFKRRGKRAPAAQ